MKILFSILVYLLLIYSPVFGQHDENFRTVTPKRFIDKVEFVIGAGLCFNHGNMFIENYRGKFANGNYVENTRLTKIGYSIGIGAYHPVKDWIDINVRLLWEQKGYKSELNSPLNPVNSDARNYITSEYDYNYLTIPITLKLQIDKRKKFTFLLGGYISVIKSVSGKEDYYNTQDGRSSSSFIGRTLVGFRADGGINTAAFIPGLQGFEEYDYGVVLGLGYELKIKGNSSINFQLLDNYGLANVNKPNFTSIPSPDEKNHTLSLMVGYAYKRKVKN